MPKQIKIPSFALRLAVILAVGLMVLLLIITQSIIRKKNSEKSVQPDTTSLIDSVVSQNLTDSLQAVTIDSGFSYKLDSARAEKSSTSVALLPEHILAKVNNEVITTEQFDSIYNSLPATTKDYYKEDKPGFLEEIITRQLLLQEARRRKTQDTPEFLSARARNPNREDDVLITVMLQAVIGTVTLSEEELKSFFEKNKDQLPDKNYESVKEQIRPMALEEKQQTVMDNFVNDLKTNAVIIRNQKWLSRQQAQTADNPLAVALRSGKPIVADFGRGTCVPCKMMQPILEKLQQQYEGRAVILILDVGEYASLARRYGIRLIPTQIFFDAAGKEIHRHQGFMPETDIIAQLEKMGIK